MIMTTVSAARRERESANWTGSFADGYLPDIARRDPGRCCVVDGPTSLSYAQVDRAADAVAASFQALGVGQRDVVSWQLPNWHEALVLHQATLRIGAVSNPIIPIYRRHEVSYILGEAASKVVVMPEVFRGFRYLDMLDEIRPGLPHLEQVIAVRAKAGAGRPGVLDFEELRRDGGQPRPVERTPDDPMLLLFTSGTTARPKGVVHSHNTLDYENRSIIDMFKLTGDDVIFMPSPVTHITGLLYGLQLPPMLGTAVVLQDVWEPGEALRLIEKHRCSFTVAATPFLHGLTHHPGLAQFDLSSLRAFMCGGADVPPSLIRDARANLGCAVSRAYGSTELPTLSTSGLADPAEKGEHTDGRAIGSARFMVVDDSDQPLASGQIGELLVAGPEMLLDYHRTSDAEGAFTASGWFRTGDLACYDGDGYVTICGRKKDVVMRGGENISVTEVENLLLEHPAVADIAIVAMPDPVMVERACAFVVPAPVEPQAPPLTLAAIAAFLEKLGVAKQKIPERLELVAELPKTASGKIQKFRLRETIRRRLSHEGGEGR